MYYIGLDIHKKHTQASVKDENGKVIVNERFLSDVVAIDAFLDRLGAAEAKVVMEATGFYQYIYEAIEARGYQVVLAHPLKLKALTAGRAKTDKNDAEMLAELLRIGAVPESYVPSKEVRELRDLTRHRESLVSEAVALKNKIHAELARRGTRPPAEARSSFSKSFVGWLKSLQISMIDDLLDVLGVVQERIKAVEARIEAEAKDDEDIRLLETIPGVGHVVAMTIKAEVGDVGRFRSADGLASYAGLVPAVRQSGEGKAHVGGMSRQGNPRLRYMLTEAVHVHVMFCQDSRLTAFFLRKKEEKGSKKATVATAKKLLEIMYLMIVRRQPFQAR
jgi:transposase